MTRVHISIETEDMDLAERIGRTLNGNLTGRFEPVDVPPAADETPDPAADFTPGANAATTAEAPEPAQPAETTEKAAATADTPEPAPSATETEQSEGVETDAAGLPWDYRIHASTKTKTADGKWKKKRGVADAERAKVEAELHQAMSIPAPESGGYTPEAAAPAPAPAPRPEPEAATPPPPAAEPTGTAAPTDFMGLVGAIGSKGASQEQINQACAACDPPIPSFQALASRPDLIPAFWEQLQKV